MRVLLLLALTSCAAGPQFDEHEGYTYLVFVRHAGIIGQCYDRIHTYGPLTSPAGDHISIMSMVGCSFDGAEVLIERHTKHECSRDGEVWRRCPLFGINDLAPCYVRSITTTNGDPPVASEAVYKEWGRCR